MRHDAKENKRIVFSDTRFILLALILFGVVIRVPAIFIPHVENDEVIYQTLADKVSEKFSDYSLQGTDILKQLPAVNYDHPVFHRPPFFVYALALFRTVFGKDLGILLPMLSGVLLIWMIYLLGRRMYDEKRALLSAFILSCCPIILFGSTRILMDIVLTALVLFTVLAVSIAAEKGRLLWYVIAGALLGAAALTKEPAYFILPACFYIVFKKGFTLKKTIYMLYLLIISFIVMLPWLYHFYNVSGEIFPWWSRVYEENIKMFPFIDMVVHRPWYFYFVQLIIIAPVYIFAYLEILRRVRNRLDLTEVFWALSYIICATILGLLGQGYQTRYIMPAVPALCFLSADSIAGKNKFIFALSILFMAYGLLIGILNSILFKPADLVGIFSFFKR